MFVVDVLVFFTVPTAVCHHNVLVLVALGPRAPKKSRENTSQGAGSHGPSISNLWQTKIVPKGQRLHFTQVPHSLGSQVEHNLQNTAKNTFFNIRRPKTNIAYSGVLLQSVTHPQADQGESIRHPCKTAIWPTPLTS